MGGCWRLLAAVRHPEQFLTDQIGTVALTCHASSSVERGNWAPNPALLPRPATQNGADSRLPYATRPP